MPAAFAVASHVEWVGTLLFAIALVHTFSTGVFERLAHTRPAHAGIWRLLGEVEVVFGFWAMILALLMIVLTGKQATTDYLDGLSYTEPLFVFAIMVVAGSRPVLQCASLLVRGLAHRLPSADNVSFYWVTLCLVPLLGSFITEPAAMTLAALILRDRFYRQPISTRMKYATLGVLFVNVSIGGTLTPFAAPPVLMVAAKWQWDVGFMMSTFGWRAALAVIVNGLLVTLLMRRELLRLRPAALPSRPDVPWPIMLIHVGFLAAIVMFAHHPALFVGLLLFFIGFTTAYQQHQDRLILREGLLVAFFLGGLVVLGGQQKWWLQALITDMSPTALFYGAVALTAVTDNAALTYLGSLVDGISLESKYSLVAGAVTGGGLTVIANAPNPAGFSILKRYFDEEAIHPIGLLAAALPPTIVAVLAFTLCR